MIRVTALHNRISCTSMYTLTVELESRTVIVQVNCRNGKAWQCKGKTNKIELTVLFLVNRESLGVLLDRICQNRQSLVRMALLSCKYE